MNKHILCIWAFCLVGVHASAQSIFSDCKQIVVVVSPRQKSVSAKLYKFEKVGKNWRQVGEVHPVNLGLKGLAWGRGLHSAKPGLQKKEGDLRSPAGIFRFGDAFGYAPASEVHFKMPYNAIVDSQICVEDSHSRFYNQIVDANEVPNDWKSREFMMRQDDQYKWGIYLKQNSPPKAEGGSCVFFHLWRAPGSGTLGCTAMEEPRMLELLEWLDPAKKPLLFQMTEADYRAYRAQVKLPDLH